MLDDSKNILEQIISQRAFEIVCNFFIDNEKYIETNGNLSKLFHQIESFLPKEHSQLIFEYEKIAGLQENIVGTCMYKRGFKDGVELKGLLK